MSSVAILLNSVWKTVNAFCIISASRCTMIQVQRPGNYALVGVLNSPLMDRCIFLKAPAQLPPARDSG